MKEPLPLAAVQEEVLEFLRHREDAALFGAQAVNAYVDEPRMTQDVDILSTRAAALAEELRAHLAKTFTIAVRMREVAGGKGFRIFQLRQPKNRHLVDVRQVQALPLNQMVADVRVPIPEELVAQKVMAYVGRKGQPKAGTDLRDLRMLLLAFPHLKSDVQLVQQRLQAAGATPEVQQEWTFLAAAPIDEKDSDEGDWSF